MANRQRKKFSINCYGSAISMGNASAVNTSSETSAVAIGDNSFLSINGVRIGGKRKMVNFTRDGKTTAMMPPIVVGKNSSYTVPCPDGRGGTITFRGDGSISVNGSGYCSATTQPMTNSVDVRNIGSHVNLDTNSVYVDSWPLSQPPKQKVKREEEGADNDDIPGVLTTIMGTDTTEFKEHGDACVVCMTNKKQLAPQECGHLSMCFKCARNMIDKHTSTDEHNNVFKCPICRVEIKKKMIKIINC